MSDGGSGRGRPRKYESNARRQKAYRELKKTKDKGGEEFKRLEVLVGLAAVAQRDMAIYCSGVPERRKLELLCEKDVGDWLRGLREAVNAAISAAYHSGKAAAGPSAVLPSGKSRSFNMPAGAREVLGVKPSEREEEINNRFKAIIAKVHSDSFRRSCMPEWLVKLMEEVTKEVNVAKDKLG